MPKQSLRQKFPVYRRDPIPHVGHGGGRGYSLCRFPYYHPVLRDKGQMESIAADLCCEVPAWNCALFKVRRLPPDPWDIIWRGTLRHHCWKQYRKYQAKGRG